MPKTLVPILAAMTLVLAACGDGGADSDTTSVDNSSEATATAPAPADQAIADASLLTLDDFPSGWESEPAEDEDDDDEDNREMADCVGVEYDELYGGGSAKADSPTFISPQDEEIDNGVAIAPDEAWMTNAFDIMSGAEFRACMVDSTQQAMAESIEEDDGDYEVGEVTINEISFEDFGDDTLALRLTIPLDAEGLSIEMQSDFVVVRVGRARIVVSASSVGSPVAVETLTEYTELSVGRLTEELGR